ncbi:hypothetical protein [Microbispora sp. ATCC PTA-5024]|uniref:hypothetical protein n=1 Tax=Microbispora sp. ATCC PTA-5024 TaxID=316330 RepID=UPI0003DC8E40|nr:hypothetical protein [Microbispora sp. ATCC PTA-5024]ETK37378.1 hypothetical protein MPTA5024_04190 [Microbispora sp. ATCC PTA-5024]
MSLPPYLWEALALDPEVVRGRARFFASYATMEPPPFDVHDLIRLARDGVAGAGSDEIVDLAVPETAAARAMVERLENRGSAGSREPWVRVAEEADAWREAAIARLPNDTASGKEALLRAAEGYDRLGLPFGGFLAASAVGDRERAVPAVDALYSLLGVRSDGPAGDQGLIGRRAALSAAAQQIAALFTAMADPGLVAHEGEELTDALATASQATSATPVGTTGEPLALWWTAGRLLAAMITGARELRTDLAAILAELAGAHGRRLRTAQLDGYHWPRGIARVSLVDLDLAGLVAVSFRALPQIGSPPWDVAEDFGHLPPLARVSLTVGVQLAEGDNPAPSSPMRPFPPDPPTWPVRPETRWRSERPLFRPE